MSLPRPPECVPGDEALARGAWAEARAAFEAALRIRELPEALEGLGKAAWWLDLADLVFDARERAYRLYLVSGDHAAAARIAVWLAWDYWAFRGENAVANGWLQRARHLLEGQPACSERAWLEVREGSLCLVEEGDPSRALALAAEGIRIAREVGDTRPVPYTIRLKFPANYAIPSHSHPTDENVVVVSGALTFGVGDALAKGAATNKTLATGGFALMPAGMNHFAYTTAQETTIVLYGQGPVEFNYVNPADDPRNAKKGTM